MTKKEELEKIEELVDKSTELTMGLFMIFKRMGLKRNESVIVLAASTSVILTMAHMKVDMYAELLKSMIDDLGCKIEYPTAAKA